VLGVLLALLAQQWLDNQAQRRQLRFTEEHLRGEVLVSAQNAFERMALYNCLKTDLTDLSERLNRPGDRWEAVPLRRHGPSVPRAVPAVYIAPLRPWGSAAWDTAVASNSLLYMPMDRVAAYARVYEAIVKLREIQNHEFHSASRLSLLSSSRGMTPEMRASLLSDLGVIDANMNFMEIISQEFPHMLRDLSFLLSAEERAGFAARIQTSVEKRGACVQKPPLTL